MPSHLRPDLVAPGPQALRGWCRFTPSACTTDVVR